MGEGDALAFSRCMTQIQPTVVTSSEFKQMRKLRAKYSFYFKSCCFSHVLYKVVQKLIEIRKHSREAGISPCLQSEGLHAEHPSTKKAKTPALLSSPLTGLLPANLHL